jgi:hypothetical protein
VSAGAWQKKDAPGASSAPDERGQGWKWLLQQLQLAGEVAGVFAIVDIQLAADTLQLRLDRIG